MNLDTSVDGWYSEPELSMLGGACKLAPDGDILEVGVFRGKSARTLAEYRGTRRLFLLDTLVCPGCDVRQWPTGDGITHATTPAGLIGMGTLALLHLDGDHTQAGVTRDLDTFGNLVMVGGRLAMHDFHNAASVRNAWDAWEHKGKFAHIGRAQSLVVFQRVA